MAPPLLASYLCEAHLEAGLREKDSPFSALMRWGTVPHSGKVKKPNITFKSDVGLFCLLFRLLLDDTLRDHSICNF